MSMARVVITAVRVEHRIISEVGRDYGVSRRWVHELVRRYDTEGETAFEPRSCRPHHSPHAVPVTVEDEILRLRKQLFKQGLDAGAETIAGTWPARTGRRRRSPRSGGSCPGGGSSPPSRRNGHARPGSGSAPRCPTNGGRPTSPIGRWPTVVRWRS
jgi:hypothetical protein